MKDKQIKIGAVLSYSLIFANTLIGLLITPYIIKSIGDSEYGIYSIMSSLATSLLVIDLGIGTATTRFIAVMKAKGDQKNIDNYIAMNVIVAGIIGVAVLAAGVVCYFGIEGLYNATLNPAQLSEAKKIFIIIMATVMSQIFENVINGAIRGYGKFIFANSVKLSRILMRVISLVVLLQFFNNAIVIAIVDLVGGLAVLLAECIYLRCLRVRIRLTHFEWALFRQSMVYTALILVQSIANQFSGNLDKLVIGAVISAEAVTVYTIGLTIYSMFATIGLSIPDLMLPKLAQMVKDDVTNTELENLSVKVGRVQFIILGAAFGGFAVLGRLFIRLWMGEGYEDAYVIAMILIAPTLITLTQKVGLVILKVKNKLVFRTVAVFIMAIVNLLVTVIGVKLYGYYAAAVGTSLTFVLCDFFAMNLYYKRALGLDYFRVLFRTVQKILPCLLITMGVLFIYKYLAGNSFLEFGIGVLLFLIVFFLLLLLFGFNRAEKSAVTGIFRKLRGKNRR